MKRIFLYWFGLGFLLAAQSAWSEVRLPRVLGDHAVLQRDKPVVVWGWADPGEKITVEIGSAQKQVVANDRGEFQATLPAMKASGPYTLTVRGSNTITVKDILVGEVWVCGGQSNMHMRVSSCANAAEEIQNGNHPKMRLLAINWALDIFPRNDIYETEWKVCTPKTMERFSATGYYFGREIHKKLNVPVGLIQACWGATRIEPWTAPEGFAVVPSLKVIYEQVQLKNPQSDLHKQRLGAFLKEVETWQTAARKAMREETDVPEMPAYPNELLPGDGRRNVKHSSSFYHGMIAPLTKFPIRGAIWFQGEDNNFTGDAGTYRDKMMALIVGWRKVWNQGDFPFYYVQLTPYHYNKQWPYALPQFWEAQAQVRDVVPNTAMAHTIDIGDVNDIHPKNKQEVGRRLALLALAKTYGLQIPVYTGPSFKAMSVQGDKLRVMFQNVGGGLASRDGKPINWFEIAGEGIDGFTEAKAEIDGPTVVLRAPGVTKPTAVRFAWHKTAQPNLMNKEGFPAAPFRADIEKKSESAGK